MVKTIKRSSKKPTDSTQEKPSSVSEPAVIAAPVAKPESADAVGAREQKSIRWYEKDGKIQWEGMREATRDALREFVQRPDLWDGLQVAKPGEAQEARKVVSDDLVSRAYDFLGNFEQFMAKKYTGCSDEIAAKVFTFDDEEKAALVPVTVRLINKWGPDWLAKFNDEIEFAIVILSIQMSKMAMLRAMLEREKAKKAANAPAPVLLRPEKPEETPKPAETTATVDVAEVGSAESLEEKDTNA